MEKQMNGAFDNVGDIFAILEYIQKALETANTLGESENLQDKLFKCNSYNEFLSVIEPYTAKKQVK